MTHWGETTLHKWRNFCLKCLHPSDKVCKPLPLCKFTFPTKTFTFVYHMGRATRTRIRLRARRSGVRFGAGEMYFSVFWSPDRLWRGPPSPHPPTRQQWGCEVSHSPPSSTEVKNECSHAYTPPVRRHGVNGGNFTFTFTMHAIRDEVLKSMQPSVHFCRRSTLMTETFFMDFSWTA